MKLRLSIRYKMLLVISVVLFTAMASYLYLATLLFTKDKLTYIYDLNSSLVQTLSEQTHSDLTVLVKELNLFIREVMQPGFSEAERYAKAAALLKGEPNILRIEIFSPDANRSQYDSRYNFTNDPLMVEAGIYKEDLQYIREEFPLPLAALAEIKDRPFLQNGSLPPDSAILTLAIAAGSQEDAMIVAVDFFHQRLLRIFGRSELYETYLVDERGIVLAHPDPDKVINRYDMSGQALVRGALESKIDRAVREFKGENGDIYLGAFAHVGLGRLTVCTQLPKKEALRAGQELMKRSSLFAVAILISAFIVSVFFSRFLSAPIRRLSEATREVGKGKFNIDVGAKSQDEIGDLASAFEQMVVALKDTEAQLIQSGKMAAFGQLGAGITHEVKNPIAGIYGLSQVAQLKLEDTEKVLELLKLIEEEAKRSNEILINFLKFAKDKSDHYDELDINRLLKETAKIFQHQLMIHNIDFEMDLDEDMPPVMGSGGELQQVLINLAMNAQQAMPKGGKVRLSSKKQEDNTIAIRLSDTGPGIPPDLRHKIFEPFFSTKPQGEGTGLGLSISFGIIRRHNGTISLESEPGEGTSFIINLPGAEA